MFRIYLLIGFLLAFISYSNATCPTDTFPGVNNTWCYKIYETPMTFENATTTCLNLNNSGNLACIHNAFENSLIRGIFKSYMTSDKLKKSCRAIYSEIRLGLLL